MKPIYSAVAAASLVLATPALATDLDGPARFCGYAPIIDLLPSERVRTLEGGIHSGSFRWQGLFGAFEVRGIGWASRPKGRMPNPPTADKPAMFAQRRVKNGFEVAIWNGAHGAAYFLSSSRISAAQMAAIRRVRLFEEGQEPSGCSLRTIFVWE